MRPAARRPSRARRSADRARSPGVGQGPLSAASPAPPARRIVRTTDRRRRARRYAADRRMHSRAARGRRGLPSRDAQCRASRRSARLADYSPYIRGTESVQTTVPRSESVVGSTSARRRTVECSLYSVDSVRRTLHGRRRGGRRRASWAPRRWPTIGRQGVPAATRRLKGRPDTCCRLAGSTSIGSRRSRGLGGP